MTSLLSFTCDPTFSFPPLPPSTSPSSHPPPIFPYPILLSLFPPSLYFPSLPLSLLLPSPYSIPLLPPTPILPYPISPISCPSLPLLPSSSIPPLTLPLSPISLLPLFPLSPCIYASPITSLHPSLPIFPYLLVSLPPSLYSLCWCYKVLLTNYPFSHPPPLISLICLYVSCLLGVTTFNHSLLLPSPSPHLYPFLYSSSHPLSLPPPPISLISLYPCLSYHLPLFPLPPSIPLSLLCPPIPYLLPLLTPPPPTSSISPSLFVCFSPTWSHTINHSLLPPSPSPHLLHLSFSVCMFSPLLGVTTLTIPSSCSCRMSILCCLRATLWVSMVTYWCTQSPQ